MTLCLILTLWIIGFVESIENVQYEFSFKYELYVYDVFKTSKDIDIHKICEEVKGREAAIIFQKSDIKGLGMNLANNNFIGEIRMGGYYKQRKNEKQGKVNNINHVEEGKGKSKKQSVTS